MGIFDKIKALVNEQSLSVSDIEKEINVSNGTISKWNLSMPKADSLFRVSQILHVSIEYFLTDFDGEKGLTLCEDKKLSNISELEQELLNNFNKLDNRGKHKIHTTIYEELDRIAAAASQEQIEINEVLKLASIPNILKPSEKSAAQSNSLFIPAGKKD